MTDRSHLPKGLRACMTCMKWVNGSSEIKCQCGHPRYTSSQGVGAAVVNARQDFPKQRLKTWSVGERVEFMRAMANLFRPYAPEVADALEAYDGSGVVLPDGNLDDTD